MFFGRNDYDPTALAESKQRLSNFQGATSISSSQYFGREEEEEFERPGSDGGLLGDGNLANLEAAARDAIARVMANPDVQNVGESIRTGALKVCAPRCRGLLSIDVKHKAFRLLGPNVSTLSFH